MPEKICIPEICTKLYITRLCKCRNIKYSLIYILYIYIYRERERERQREMYRYIYISIHLYIERDV